jgi:hypothetical protein
MERKPKNIVVVDILPVGLRAQKRLPIVQNVGGYRAEQTLSISLYWIVSKPSLLYSNLKTSTKRKATAAAWQTVRIGKKFAEIKFYWPRCESAKRAFAE